MIALLHAYALLVSQTGSLSPAPCKPVDTDRIHAAVKTILALKSPQRRAEGTSDLAGYWKDTCPSSRQRIEPPTVGDVARLLINRESRLMASFMLMDVSDNLKAAKPAVTTAVAAQIRSDRRLYQGPTPLYRNHHFTFSVPCGAFRPRSTQDVLEKEVCADLLRYERELNELRGRARK